MPQAPRRTAAGAGAYSRRRVLHTALALGGSVWLSGCKGAQMPAAQFWQRSFELADGGATLAVDSLRGRPLLVNLWATWCPPCVQEMPLLDAFYRQTAPDGWGMLSVALDTSPHRVSQFLRRAPVSFPVALCSDPAEAKVLAGELDARVEKIPLSLLMDGAGIIRQRKIGVLSEADLESWRAAVMAGQTSSG